MKQILMKGEKVPRILSVEYVPNIIPPAILSLFHVLQLNIVNVSMCS